MPHKIHENMASWIWRSFYYLNWLISLCCVNWICVCFASVCFYLQIVWSRGKKALALLKDATSVSGCHVWKPAYSLLNVCVIPITRVYFVGMCLPSLYYIYTFLHTVLTKHRCYISVSLLHGPLRSAVVVNFNVCGRKNGKEEEEKRRNVIESCHGELMHC